MKPEWKMVLENDDKKKQTHLFVLIKDVFTGLIAWNDSD